MMVSRYPLRRAPCGWPQMASTHASPGLGWHPGWVSVAHDVCSGHSMSQAMQKHKDTLQGFPDPENTHDSQEVANIPNIGDEDSSSQCFYQKWDMTSNIQ